MIAKQQTSVIESLLNCAGLCNQFVATRWQENEVEHIPWHGQLFFNCSDACAALAHLLNTNSAGIDYVCQKCIDICRNCIEESEQLADAELLRCSAACKIAVAECEQLLYVLIK